MNTIIILGNDHTNTLGVIQSLGNFPFKRVALIWGCKTGIVKSSRYTDVVYACGNEHACVEVMVKVFSHYDTKIPVIACSDSAALVLEENRSKLEEHFIFGYVTGNYPFRDLFKKELQVKLAHRSGFNVPQSWIWDNFEEVPKDIVYPCIIKPLVSCNGAKCDIKICRTEAELKNDVRSLMYTKEVILQQYIDHDFEISILGCGKKNGICYIPVVEDKLTLYPKNVGLECLSYIKELQDPDIKKCITNLISTIGYVGLFSVEMMHSRTDGKYYFTEINLRNDGANAIIYKYGVNLPFHFVCDVLDKVSPKDEELKEGYYIWDMHHFLSLVHREISIRKWIDEIRHSNGFMTYFINDKKPFYKQYINWCLSKLHLKKDEQYA